ncbi:hypothetical protein [uncultured Clostridium sp.]|uniref:rolling circle replication-associated protein n=1 Tax=uncultured Clostridium sp. TaxID=59620 RepID=UPI002619A030|nr:hypothetical protein [uncultured Clostridium sp.]
MVSIYNLKIIQCGDRVEIYKFTNYIVREQGKEEDFYRFIENDKREKNVRSEKNKDEEKELNKVDNLNRSRNKIVRLIKCNKDMKTFITLTFAKEMDYKESKKCLNNMFNKLRRKYKNLKYIWVLEYGEKGTKRLHYHLLCNIPIAIKLSGSNSRKTKAHKSLENEFKNKYWNDIGFVDIRELEQEDNTNIALYVSSYIVKGLAKRELEGYRVFGYSNKTLLKPITKTLMDKRKITEILEEYKNYKSSYSNSYEIGYKKNGEYKGGRVIYMDMERSNQGI